MNQNNDYFIRYAVFVVGCSTAGKGYAITYDPKDQIHRVYASILQDKLGPIFKVKQFGQGGMSVSETANGSIWNSNNGKRAVVFNDLINVVTNKEAFDICFQGKCDFNNTEFIFVHNWGTNAADERNVRTAEKDFVKSYNKYLDLFPRGKHYICYLPPTFGRYDLGNGNFGFGHEIGTINKLMPQVKGDGFIDLRYGWDPSMYYDQVHQNTKGATHIATIMDKDVKAGLMLVSPKPPKPPIDESITPIIELVGNRLRVTNVSDKIKQYSWKYSTVPGGYTGWLDYANYLDIVVAHQINGNEFWCTGHLIEGDGSGRTSKSNKIIYTKDPEIITPGKDYIKQIGVKTSLIRELIIKIYKLLAKK